MLGGGASLTGSALDGLSVVSSVPSGTLAWTATARSTLVLGAGAFHLKTYAICATVAS